jgi:hypothetical protein
MARSCVWRRTLKLLDARAGGEAVEVRSRHERIMAPGRHQEPKVNPDGPYP